MNLEELKSNKAVIFDNLANYKTWFVGAFSPSLLATGDFEVGLFDIPKNHESDGHIHRYVFEINVIIDGECLVTNNGIKSKLKSGDIFSFPPNVRSLVKYTKATKLLVIKTPSIPTDKEFPHEEDDGA